MGGWTGGLYFRAEYNSVLNPDCIFIFTVTFIDCIIISNLNKTIYGLSYVYFKLLSSTILIKVFKK